MTQLHVALVFTPSQPRVRSAVAGPQLDVPLPFARERRFAGQSRHFADLDVLPVGPRRRGRG